MTIIHASDVAESGGISLRPSMLDALALVVVGIGGVALSQYDWASTRTRHFASDPNILINGLNNACNVLNAATPAGFGLAVVAFARVQRERGPQRGRLFFQPGVAACVAFVAALIAGAIGSAVWAVRRFEFHNQWLAGAATNIFFNLAQYHLSFCVLGVWAFLGFGGLWTQGRNWVNWLGIALGVMGVVQTLLWCLP